MEAFWTLDTRHILGPDAFCIRYRLTFTATYRYKQLLFFSHRLTLAKIQIINEFSIGASASLWECMLNAWLGRLYQLQEPQSGLQFEARIAQRQSLVKQLHERQLDLLITTEAPKMDEFSSQLLGHFTLALYCSSPARKKSELNYLRLEWGPDFQQHETGLIAADEVPVLTTSSAELARQQLSALNGCSWLPVNWANEKGGLHTVADSATLSRPLYAIWLQNSDKYSLICDLLKTDVLDEQ